MSRTVDVRNLPSHSGPKRLMVASSSHGKTPIIKLDPSPVENPAVVLPFEVLFSEAPSRPDLLLSTVLPAKNLATTSHTLVRSEALAWNRFKTVLKEDDVMACYDMSIKEFEYSTIHDLFKEFFVVHNNLPILLPSVLTFCFTGHVQIYGGIYASHRLRQRED